MDDFKKFLSLLGGVVAAWVISNIVFWLVFDKDTIDVEDEDEENTSA